VSSATQMLKTPPGLLASCAKATPPLEGAVLSSTTFQSLPSPLPVFSTFQPAGTLPISALLKVRILPSSAHAAVPATASTASAVVHRIVRSPGTEEMEHTPCPIENVHIRFQWSW